jgi:hypothetical protein
MSLRLDAIAYRNRADYRLRRLEQIILILDKSTRGCNILLKDKEKYWDNLDEIRTEIYNIEHGLDKGDNNE